MKKIILFISSIILLFTGCTNSDALKFKDEYESLNGKTNSSGKEHRTVSIDSDNPFVYISTSDLIEKIENKDTFYVYFGSKSCPWCRSMIEKSIELAQKYDIETIYYIDIWDNDSNEILRDKYIVNNGSLEKIVDGTEDYYKLLSYFDNVLANYTITDSEGNSYDVSEKRIYAPNFIYVENGKAVKLVTGNSSKQTNSRGELTDEILEDEEQIFESLFEND